MADYRRRDAAGQHASFGIARRYIRMGMCLMKNSGVYLPPRLRRTDIQPQERAGYYLKMWPWPYLRDKWQKLYALQAAFAHDRPLGQWRNVVQELYDIKFTL